MYAAFRSIIQLLKQRQQQILLLAIICRLSDRQANESDSAQKLRSHPAFGFATWTAVTQNLYRFFKQVELLLSAELTIIGIFCQQSLVSSN